ncbi:HD domain-containing protein [Thiocapsa bogorovii]|uniref:HD domain-containing protein n=1 Tax=Thiocapsa bogorovii TaxID=521689 RepID=UPI001E332E2A|nr:hypothetical protein [Thiocapsa bogorovii]UHD16377.1 hypothetical protein LT988_24570 [Thiocapsa bogorovii]
MVDQPISDRFLMGSCAIVPADQANIAPLVHGMGILVSDTEVITCAHVLEDALGKDWQRRGVVGRVGLCFLLPEGVALRMGEVDQARLNPVHGGVDPAIADTAVVTIAKGEPLRARRARLSETESAASTQLRAFGFPYVEQADQGYSHPIGQWAWGRPAPKVFGGRSQFDGKTGEGAFITNGFSGAGVYDPDQDAIVGMVVSKDLTPETKVAQLIDVRSLRRAWTGTDSVPEAFLRGAWVAGACNSGLWPMVHTPDALLADRLRTLIQRAEDLYLEARRSLPRQRWSDWEASLRALRCLWLLLDPKAAEPPLKAAEAAVAIFVPFLYEAVLAAAELGLAHEGDVFKPADYGRDSKQRMALALRNRLDAERARGRRRDQLNASGEKASADDLTAWQMLRFLHASGELWHHERETAALLRGWVADDLDALFADAPPDHPGEGETVVNTFDVARLLGLTRVSLSGYEQILAASMRGNRDQSPRLTADRYVGDGQVINETKLAHLLHLAFGMALDPRRMPPVLLEHIGLDPAVNARALTLSLRGVDRNWTPKDAALDLRLKCPSAALDAALEIQIDELNQDLDRLLRDEEPARDRPPGMPEHLGNRVEAKLLDNDPVYERPHLRFQLDPTRVRELLMGENLYQDPMLALRELYQNALDACRYRRARDRYLRAKDEELVEQGGKRPEREPEPYRGRILLWMDTDADGQTVIECRDDGIGMTEQHLRNLFARVGSRFTDTDELQLERAAWQAKDIAFHANSRFGIGVLSYFMLADKLVVCSRRWATDGLGCEDAIEATLVGSGSLFGVKSPRRRGVERPGTSVRLYLSRPGLKPRDLAEAVLEWLWLPEIDTVIKGATTLELRAGEPTPSMRRRCGELAPIPEPDRESKPARFWWSSALIADAASNARRGPGLGDGQGCTLADGIFVRNADERGFTVGLVANLTEELNPELSVDRRQVTAWPAGQARLAELLGGAGDGPDRLRVAASLLAVAGVGLEQMGGMLEQHPGLILALDRGLREGTCPAPAELRWGPEDLQWGPESQPPARVAAHAGLFEADQELVFSVQNRIRFEGAKDRVRTTLKRLRLGALQRAGLALPAVLSRLVAAEVEAGVVSPRAGAWSFFDRFVLARRDSSADRLYPGRVRPDTAPRARMAAFAAWTEQRGASVAEILRPLVEVGLVPGLASADLDLLAGLPPMGRAQLELMSERLDGRWPWVDAVGPVQLGRAARHWSLPLREVAECARPLGTLGLVLADLDRFAAAPELDEQRLILLARDLEGNRWESEFSDPTAATLSVADLVRAAQRWSKPVTEVAAMAADLACLGVTVPTLATAVSDQVPTERQAALLTYNMRIPGAPLDSITLAQVAGAAYTWSLSVGEVIDQLAGPLQALGVPAPGLEALPRDLRISEAQARLFSRGRDAEPPWLERVGPAELAVAVAEFSKSPQQCVEWLRPLVVFGLASDPHLDQVPAELPVPIDERHLRLIRDGWGDETGGANTVGIAQIIASADAFRGLPLAQIIAKARELRPLGFEVAEPPASAAAWLADPDVDRAARVLLPEIDPQEQYLSPLNLAYCCLADRKEPAEFHPALLLLRALGVDVADCLDYVADGKPPRTAPTVDGHTGG